VGGLVVAPGGGEALHEAVLDYLHRLAMATGHSVHATVFDGRSGYITPVEVLVDGSSRFSGEPVYDAGVLTQPEQAPVPGSQPVPTPASVPAPVAEETRPEPVSGPGPGPGPGPTITARGADAAPASGSAPASRSAPTAPTAPAADPAPAAVTGPAAMAKPAGMTTPAAVTEPPAAETSQETAPAQASGVHGESTQDTTPSSDALSPVPDQAVTPSPEAGRGGPGVSTPAAGQAPSDIPEFLSESVARINEAIRLGRIESAAAMAHQSRVSAAQAFGEDHPHVFHVQELCAYVAYLAGDPGRSMAMSLDTARSWWKRADPRAYHCVLQAAAAWRAVPDPREGMRAGRDLISLWSELASAPGPAAADITQLEAARRRMTRLSQRARKYAQSSDGQGLEDSDAAAPGR
jgi:hypothetical protein